MNETMTRDEPAIADESGVLRVLQSRQETKAFYNKIAHVYDLLAERSEQPMRAAGLDMLDVQPGEHVLEIGFGTGHTLVELAGAAGPDGGIHGVDLAEKMSGGRNSGGPCSTFDELNFSHAAYSVGVA